MLTVFVTYHYFLGLRNMSVIRDVVGMCPELKGKKIPLNDPYVFQMVSEGKTAGVFQIESAGMQKLMKDMFFDVSGRLRKIENKYGVRGFGERMNPYNAKAQSEMEEMGNEMFERLIAAISLFRPGPMDCIPQYIEGMRNPESIHYDTPELEPILARTYGVICYQEQVQEACRKLAGYSLGRADLIRRAMGKKKQKIMDAEKEIFLHGNASSRKDGEALVPGCIANGISEEAAQIVWDKMAAFAKYAFNKSHSAGYSVISVTTAYMKLYYGAEFCIANLNSLIGKADEIQHHLNEARKMGIPVLGPSLNHSKANFSLENGAIRVGLQGLKNLGTTGEDIVNERNDKNWSNMEDFIDDMLNVIDKRSIEALAYSGAFDEFGVSRKVVVSKATDIAVFIKKMKEFKANSVDKEGNALIDVPEIDSLYKQTIKVDMSSNDEFDDKDLFAFEKEYVGLYVSGHPCDSFAHVGAAQGAVSIHDIMPVEDESGCIPTSPYDGQTVTVMGLCHNVRSILTKKGDTMHILTIEDGSGEVNVTVFKKTADDVSKADTTFFSTCKGEVIVVGGKVQSNSYGTNIVGWTLARASSIKIEQRQVLVETKDKKTFNKLIQVIEGYKKGTDAIVAYYEIDGVRKEKNIGNFNVGHTQINTLKSNFRISVRKG